MGGHYPTQPSGWGAANVRPIPVRDIPPIPASNRDPYNPRRSLQRTPKWPWRPPGYFPNGWKPPKVPFGRRMPMPIFPAHLNPNRAIRLMPWFGPALAVGAAWYAWNRGDTLKLSEHGYTRCCGPTGSPIAFQSIITNTTRTVCGGSSPPGGIYGLCGTGGQPYQGEAYFAIPAHDQRTTSVVVLYGMPEANPDRTKWVEVWHKPRDASGPANPIAQLDPEPQWTFLPDFVPMLDINPEFWPPLSPAPYVPPVIPVWGDNPRQIPAFEPDPNANGEPMGERRKRYKPDVKIRPATNATRVGRNTHQRRPPGKREYETKYNAKGFKGFALYALRIANGVYGGMTEVMDLAAALYSALPDHVIASRPDFRNGASMAEVLNEMLTTIWKHRAEIDYQEASYNLAVNQVEDWAWGKYFKAMKDMSQRGPYMEGYSREYGELQEVFLDAMKEAGVDARGIDPVWFLRP